jgi:ATP-dependent helicase HrpA
VRSWDFGDSLPTRVEVRRPGMTLQGYPALVEQDGAVNLRLLDSPEAARVAHRAGVRRLFMIELRREFDDLGRSRAAFAAMALNYATIGSAAELRSDLLSLIAERAFYADQPGDVRTHEEFVRRSEAGWKRLDGAAQDVGPVVEQVLALYQPLLRQISAATAPAAWTASVADLQQQLAYLMFRGFLRYTPWDWLRHYPRYLKAAQARWHKLANAGVNRDVQSMAILTPLWKQYLQRLASHRSRGVSDGQLGLYRWMIEEMRVSLFAQELKTAIPVSPRRLAEQWAKVQP